MISLMRLSPKSTVGIRRAVRPSSGQSPAMRQLPPLLHVAGELELDDATGWAALSLEAHEVVNALVEAGQLSGRLRIERDDEPAAVANALAMAWRQVTAPSHLRHHRM